MAKYGIIGAMETEISLLKQQMQQSGEVKETKAGSLNFFEGTISGKQIVLVKSGVGKVNAALCAQRLILQFGVDAVINTGIAGAMGGNLKIFDMVASSDALYHDVQAVAFGSKETEIPQMSCSDFKADEVLVKKAVAAFEAVNKNPERKIVVGRVATGDQFIADKETKNHIKEVCSPVCVEMEGAGIAHACYLNNVPYLILRAISDMADETVEQTYSFNEDTAAQISAGLLLELIKSL